MSAQCAVMNRIAFLAIAALLLPALEAGAQPSRPAPRAGDVYEITTTRDSVTATRDPARQDSFGSSGTTHDQDTTIERVIAVRADGLELEYDLPSSIPVDVRAIEWHFPVRVFRPHSGPLQLLNRPELEARLEAWLRRAELPREACGHWYFTWNAFQVECDPEAVIGTIEALDLSSTELREGALYRDRRARAPAAIARRTAGPAGATFAAELEIDPDAFRRARAEADLVIAEIMSRPLTLEAAMRERAQEEVSGTISVTFETDANGNVRRRTAVVRSEVRKPDGETETETVTETVERRPARGSSGESARQE